MDIEDECAAAAAAARTAHAPQWRRGRALAASLGEELRPRVGVSFDGLWVDWGEVKDLTANSGAQGGDRRPRCL